MVKSVMLAICLMLSTNAAAFSQCNPWQDTAGNGCVGSVNQRTSDVTMTAGNTAPMNLGTPDPYYIQAPSNTTTGPTAQSAYQNMTNSLPSTSGMPYGGTYLAPANIAGMVWGGPTLPVTNLDSFVYQSGMNGCIYGDEGTCGPPPLGCFGYGNTIGAGINASSDAATLTTGHACGALPSSWLTPQ